MKKELAWFVLVAGVLVAALVFVRSHDDAIADFIDGHAVLGLALYLVLNVLDAVVAPGATLPLIPVAAHVWGRVGAALVTTAGWTMGSLVAFLIARRWGYPIVQKITSIRRVRQLKRFIPKNLFWSVAAIRLVMPMDVISYALGLFTDVGWWEYLAATALGLTPSAFVLAYVGRLSHAYELIAIGAVGVLVLGSILVRKQKTSRVTAVL